ncbi:porin [Pseudoalteromonas sp. KG3]|uniref:Porin n=1 Tax=Pseudoalteromonas prydzensis TaxID=182141 RepID=A0ABR9FK82_9GAMM|nr:MULTISPECIES: porin [Pseudoalteromonas]MBE0457242.1 porin [Pseudoalteromonas prydzensis]WKD26060.1 porin [Pseudoalteromonas sp. KG3]
MIRIDKKLISASVACALGVTGFTQTVHAVEYDIYGKAEVQIAKTDNGTMRFAKEGTQIDAPFSRIGITGKHGLSDSLNVVFKYEVQVKGFENDDLGDPFRARNTYLGLSGSFGEVVVGRNDTRFKYSEGKIDNFNETQADIAQLLPGQARIGDTITYTSKSFAGAQLSLTYAPKDDRISGKDGFAATVMYGDRNLKNENYYLALSHVDSLNNITATRIAAAWLLNNLQLGAIIQRSETAELGDKSGNGYVLSASYKLDKWLPKVQFVRDESGIHHIGTKTGQQWTTGVDYLFDKQTTAYLFYTDLDLETKSDSSLALGLKYKF